jgi:hypothetical protein
VNLPQIIEELETACTKLGVALVYAELTGEGMSTGGLCRVKGEWRVIVEKRASPGEKASVLARALSQFDLEQVFLSPQARELVLRTTATQDKPSA